MHQFDLPKVQGDLPKLTNIIYVSCDIKYYRMYVVALIRSTLALTKDIGIHVHLICYEKPTDLIKNDRTTHSYEIISRNFIQNIQFTTQADKISRQYNVHKNLDIYRLKEIIYFSCARFMQWHYIFKPYQHILQVDADTVLCKSFTVREFQRVTQSTRALPKPKDPANLIASTVSPGAFKGGMDFRKKFHDRLLEEFRKGAYWFLDQDILKELFSEIRYTPIPFNWGSWGINRDDIFSTGKGSKKHDWRFKARLDRWLRLEEK